jgi:hypothetical protein
VFDTVFGALCSFYTISATLTVAADMTHFRLE